MEETTEKGEKRRRKKEEKVKRRKKKTRKKEEEAVQNMHHLSTRQTCSVLYSAGVPDRPAVYHASLEYQADLLCTVLCWSTRQTC